MLPPVGEPTKMKDASSFNDTAFKIALEKVCSPIRQYFAHFWF